MKKSLISIFFVLSITQLSACNDNYSTISETSSPSEQQSEENSIAHMKLKITVDNQEIIATLEDNPTAKDFISLLPFTVKLDDYAGTEKIFYPSDKLSTQDAPESINPKKGDITYYSPWGNIAIFYKDFRTSNNLIRIARIENGIDLLEVANSIENVTFELIEEKE